MDCFDFFHGDITPTMAENLLLKVKLAGRFLLRECKGDSNKSTQIIVSFLDAKVKVKHYILPTRSDNNFAKAHPEVRGKPRRLFLLVFKKMQDSCSWMYPVNIDPDHDFKQNCSDEIEGVERCHICGVINPRKNHKVSHHIAYCIKCDTVIMRRDYSQHKCNMSWRYCDVCTYSTLKPSNLKRHEREKHKKKISKNISNTSDTHYIKMQGSGEEIVLGF